MALVHTGTAATNSLNAFVWRRGLISPSSVALLKAGILNDLSIGGKVGSIVPGAYDSNGLLTIPNRGTLQLFPGDVIAFDTVSGWPIVVSALAYSIGGSVWSPPA